MSLAAALTAVATCCMPTPQPQPRPVAPLRAALASWYDDAGATASGAHYAYGFASLLFASRWGHRVTFCYGRRCVVGRLDDHGPYVAGRSFDLNAALKAALGCSDLCWLRWRDWRAPRLGAQLQFPAWRYGLVRSSVGAA